MMSPRSPNRRSTGSRSSSSCQRPGAISSARPSRRSFCSRPARKAWRKPSSSFASRAHHALFVHLAQQPPVEAGEALLLDLGAQALLDLAVAPEAQIEGDDLGRTLAHAVPDVIAGDNEILAGVVLAAQQDVGVGMAGVVMVDGDPIEPGIEIGLHARHQPPRHALQIVIGGAVIGRDDEAELMPVAVAALQEGAAIGAIMRGIIELAGQPFAGDAIALQIAQMHLGGIEPALQLDHARFDDHAPTAESGVFVARGQHPPHAGAAADAGAGEAGAARARQPARFRRAFEHRAEIAPLAFRRRRADAAQLRFEFIVARHRHHHRQDIVSSTRRSPWTRKSRVSRRRAHTQSRHAPTKIRCADRDIRASVGAGFYLANRPQPAKRAPNVPIGRASKPPFQG